MFFGAPPEMADSHIIKECAIIEKWSVGCMYLGGGSAFILSSVFGLSDVRNERKINSVLSHGVP